MRRLITPNIICHKNKQTSKIGLMWGQRSDDKWWPPAPTGRKKKGKGCCCCYTVATLKNKFTFTRFFEMSSFIFTVYKYSYVRALSKDLKRLVLVMYYLTCLLMNFSADFWISCLFCVVCGRRAGLKRGLWTKKIISKTFFYMHNGYFHLIVHIRSILCT